MLSTKPYLIRALWSWCCDAGLTPYLTVFVDEQCQVPLNYLQDGTLTLNLSPSATGALDIGNEWISLTARFGGVPKELMFPVGAVIGIFARENGAGMEFSYEPSVHSVDVTPIDPPEKLNSSEVPASEVRISPAPKKTTRPTLHRVK